MKKKILAFYDLLLYGVVCIPPAVIAVYIFYIGKGFGDTNWLLANWYLVLFFAFAIVIPLCGSLLLRDFTVTNGENARFYYFPFTFSWKKAANNIDIQWNQEIILSEVEAVEVVRLSREEKRVKVYYKHLRNKYLKICLKYGKTKYVYVGNYSGRQIEKICGLLCGKSTPKKRR